MLGSGAVRRTGTLILLLALVAVGGEGAVAFLSPAPGEILLGETVFKFEVEAGTPPVDRVDVYVGGKLVGSATAPAWTLTWSAPDSLVGTRVTAVAFAGDKPVERVELPTQSLGYSQELEVTAVQLFPVVRDRKGRYVSSLKREDFEVLEQGKPVPVETFSTEVSQLKIAILLDVSGSMVPKLAQVQEAACAFVDKLGASDEISVYSFNQALAVAVTGATDHAEVKRSIRSLKAAGGTALYDAVSRVAKDLAKKPGRKAIFLFSDGQDEISVLSLPHAVRMVSTSDAIVYAVGAGDDDRSIVARKDLDELATATGGEAYFVAKTRELDRVFAAVLLDLRSQYFITFTPSPGPAGERRVEVRAKSERYTVRCRKSYRHG